jgi:hypothetical protein
VVDWGDLSWIARLVEYGHRVVRGGYSHLDRSGRAHGPGREVGEPVPPHPFARRTVAACSEEVVQVFTNTLAVEIQKAGEF